MPKPIRLALLTSLLTLGLAPSALAHSGNPNYKSVLDGVKPSLPGIKVEVLGSDSFLKLTSSAKQPVMIFGYDGEPYTRILPDGTVEQNHNSPAYWINQDRFGETAIPDNAKSTATPDWQVLDKTGSVTWHDHRMHWMSKDTPTQVKDKSQKTKVFDYKIQIAEGSKKADITGTLYWVGSDGGPSIAAIVGMIVVVLLALGGSIFVIRRRNARAEQTETPATGEAW